MQVVGVTEFGGPDQLGVHEVPDPQPGPGQVCLRVEAAAVSPTDTHVRAGTYGTMGAAPPWVPGMDAAGTVLAVGEGTPYRVGDVLMAIATPRGGEGHGGAYVEQLIGPWQSMAPVPAGVDTVTASTLPMNGLTAVQALEKLALAPGDTLLVSGAAGTLGSYVVQLAALEGLVVVADAAPDDVEDVRAAGATHVVRRGEGLAGRVRELFPDGVDAAVDAAVLDAALVPAVRDGGGFASVRFWDDSPGRGITVHPVRVVDEYRSHAKLSRLARLVEDGSLRLRVAGTYPMTEAAAAHRRLERGGVRGRLVLTF